MFNELEQVTLREMDRSRLPGLAVALVKGHDIVWSKGEQAPLPVLVSVR